MRSHATMLRSNIEPDQNIAVLYNIAAWCSYPCWALWVTTTLSRKNSQRRSFFNITYFYIDGLATVNEENGLQKLTDTSIIIVKTTVLSLRFSLNVTPTFLSIKFHARGVIKNVGGNVNCCTLIYGRMKFARIPKLKIFTIPNSIYRGNLWALSIPTWTFRTTSRLYMSCISAYNDDYTFTIQTKSLYAKTPSRLRTLYRAYRV